MSHQADNIFAGTQVVSLVEVRGTNNSLVHPRGAVGVVTRTPTGDQSKFLVRFPDGFEASLPREQLDVLKHFKDRIPGAETSVEEFDLEKLVIYPLRQELGAHLIRSPSRVCSLSKCSRLCLPPRISRCSRPHRTDFRFRWEGSAVLCQLTRSVNLIWSFRLSGHQL
jgi:hypothetical protein